MELNFESYLKGFASFGRSTSISVLVGDQSLQEAYRDALDHGDGTCNRQRTIIIGDKGVGKSSTLEMLTGGYCDPNIEHNCTEGIDITVCETSDLCPEWEKVEDSLKADDPKLSAAWCVCKEEDCFKGVLKEGQKLPTSVTSPKLPRVTRRRKREYNPRQENIDKANPNVETGLVKKAGTVLYILAVQVQCLLPIPIMIVLNKLVGGYAPFAWVVTAFLCLFADFNNAYRFGTACALQGVLIDVISHLLVSDLQLSFNWELLSAIATFVIACPVAGTISFLCGAGARTGMAVAFCLLSRPASFGSFRGEHGWTLTASWAIMVIVHTVAHLLGVVVVRQAANTKLRVHVTLRMAILIWIGSTIVVFILQFLFPLGRYLTGFFLGVATGISSITGVLYGRALAANGWLQDKYLQKKVLGFISALIFGQLIGWTLNLSGELSQVIGILSFILRDFYIGFQYHRIKNAGMPLDVICHQMHVSSRGQDATIMKLIVWDFAGDSVYKFMQQFFLPKSAVFILAFNFEHALQDRVQQVEKLRQWLYTVKAHSTVLDALVFIVGTHRDSVDDDGLENITVFIRESLYKDFCDIIAINSKNEAPLFPVENSRPMDEDGILLRETIKCRAKERPFLKQKQPVWYLRLLEIINKRKSKRGMTWYIERQQLVEEAQESGFDEDQVHTFLKFCHQSGEFIYRGDDNLLKEYVILNPQVLLDIMTDLVQCPPLSERTLEDARKWQTLMTHGVASVDLLAEIIGDDDRLVATVTRFLEAFNMLLPVRPANEAHFTQCIVPSHLPNGNPEECWDDAPDDEEFFFDFGYVPSEAIFHRLLARCWYHNLDNASTDKLYRQCGVFCFKEDAIFFMIQLLMDTISQQLIRLVVQSSDEERRCGAQVLQWITAELEDIREQDFPNLSYRVGPSCEVCSEREGPIKVLEICANGQAFPTANSPVKKFLDRGRYHEVHLVPKVCLIIYHFYIDDFSL